MKDQVVVYNSVFLKMLGVHAIIWFCVALFIQFQFNVACQNAHPSTVDLRFNNAWKIIGGWCYDLMGGGNSAGSVWVFFYIFGNIPLFALWVALWLVAGVVVSTFSPDAYIPFDFMGFLTLVGFYAALATFFTAIVLQATTSPGVESSRPVTASGGSARAIRAMVKALFVAVVSGIGGKLGGWIGGILVFVISAGLSAFFEIPSQTQD